ncbi:MAG: hypothetical protein AAF568_08460 [Pseudomonadota bacterium]
MKRVFALPLAMLLGGCQATVPLSSVERWFAPEAWPQTQRLAGPIEPISRPTLGRMNSMRVRNLVTGQVETLRVSRFGNGVRVRETDGCTWTRSYDWFAPSDSFAACGNSENWHTASATVAREGSLYPIRIGKRATYQRDAVSWNGRTSSRRTQCEVTGQEAVLRPTGATPAYVVTCDDGRVTRTTWYAPSEGPVAYHEKRQGRGVRDAWLRLD